MDRTTLSILGATALLVGLGCGQDDGDDGAMTTCMTNCGAAGSMPTSGVAGSGASAGAGTASAGTGGAGSRSQAGGQSPTPTGGTAATQGGTGATQGSAAGSGGGANAADASVNPADMMPTMSSPDAGMMPDAMADAATPDPVIPATGTFPPVSDLTAEGPYGSSVITNSGPDGNYTIYHPEQLAPDGVPNPIVTWGNGGGTTPDLYPLLPHLASHGFVVVASNNPLVTGPEVRAGLDWIVEQNDDESSVFYQKLDVENAGGVGYSFGGLATLDNSDDPRYNTIIIISGGSMDANRAANIAKVSTPSAYFCTADAASEGNCEGDYDALTLPVFFGVINGSGHVDVVLDASLIERLNRVVLAWFRWFLMADETQRDLFLGDDCGLCQDSAWSVHPPKNWP